MAHHNTTGERWSRKSIARIARTRYSEDEIYMDRGKLEDLQAFLRQYERGHRFESLAPAKDVEFDDTEANDKASPLHATPTLALSSPHATSQPQHPFVLAQ